MNFTFTTQDTGTGTWKEEDAESGDYEGTLKFEIIRNAGDHQNPGGGTITDQDFAPSLDGLTIQVDEYETRNGEECTSWIL